MSVEEQTRIDTGPIDVNERLEILAYCQREIAAMVAAVEALVGELHQVQAWARRLPERWGRLEWGTSALNEAIDAITTAGERLEPPHRLAYRLAWLHHVIVKTRIELLAQGGHIGTNPWGSLSGAA